MRSTRMMVVVALTLLAGACASDASTVDAEASSAATEVLAEQVEPTAAPDPTEPPEPTAVPTEAPEPTPVPTEVPEPTPVPTEVPDATERDFSAVTDAVAAFVDERELNGAGLIIVEKDEGVLYHEHFGEFTEDRISLIASSSKMISAGVLLKLQEEGLLDIDASVAAVADWAPEDSVITPAQLLSNSSGLVGLGPDLLYAPYFCQWNPAALLQDCATQVISTADDDDDVIEADSEFRYGGAQWQVAGGVAEAASGQSWDELINEIYAEPCGVDSLGYISLGSVVTTPGYPTVFAGDPSSVEETANPNIEGGAYITSGDYGELLLMHLRGGMCGENQVLSPESLATMHADRISETYDGDAGEESFGYGMGWWVDRDTERISDGGAWGTVPWLDLDDGYGAYLVIEDLNTTGGELQGLIEELVHTAVTGT